MQNVVQNQVTFVNFGEQTWVELMEQKACNDIKFHITSNIDIKARMESSLTDSKPSLMSFIAFILNECLHYFLANGLKNKSKKFNKIYTQSNDQ